MKTTILTRGINRPPQSTVRRGLLTRAIVTCALLTALPFAARAQSSVLYTNNFVSGAGWNWNAMTPFLGANCGAVAARKLLPGDLSTFACRIDSFGGGAGKAAQIAGTLHKNV